MVNSASIFGAEAYNATLINNPTINAFGPSNELYSLELNSGIFISSPQSVSIPEFSLTLNSATIMGWFKINGYDNSSVGINIFDFYDTEGGSNLYLNISNATDIGSIIFYLNNGSGTVYNISSIRNVLGNNWVHFALVMNSGTWITYINGVQHSSQNGFPTNTIPFNSNFIGTNNSVNNSNIYLKGNISDFYLYNAALTESQVYSRYLRGLIDNYSSGSAGYDANYYNMFVYYNFNIYSFIQNEEVKNLALSNNANYLDGILENNATINNDGITYNTKSVYLNSSLQQHITIPPFTLTNTNELSITFLYKSNDTTTYNRVFEFSDYLGDQQNNICFNILNEVTMQFYVSTSASGNRIFDTSITGATFNDNNWHHIAIIIGTNSIRFYTDGSLLLNSDFDGLPTSATYSTNYIGRPTVANYYYGNIHLSNFRMFHSALSDGTLYNIYEEDVNGIYDYLDPKDNNYEVNNPGPYCFNKGCKLLCLNKKMKDEYIAVEKLKEGSFVKTYKHGYRKIVSVYKNTLKNNPHKFNECMYKMTKTLKNGITDDIIVTGGHSVLVDEINGNFNEENERLFNGASEMIEDKHLLLAAVSKDFEKICDTRVYKYYHFVLENNGDNNERYGVWCNNLLMETPSLNFFNQHLDKKLL